MTTIHELPAAVFDAWAQALGAVPREVTADDHALGFHLDLPVGAFVLENQRYVLDEQEAPGLGPVMFIRGLACRRGSA